MKEACRLFLGGLFLWAAWPKLGDPAAMALAISNYQLLHPRLIGLAAYLLPALELVCGTALLLGVLTRGAALLSAMLSSTFLIGVAAALVRGLDIECGCFEGGRTGWGHLLLNLVMVAASVYLLRHGGGSLAADRWLEEPLDRPAELQ